MDINAHMATLTSSCHEQKSELYLCIMEYKRQGQAVNRYPLERGLCLMLMLLVAALLICDRILVQWLDSH